MRAFQVHDFDNAPQLAEVPTPEPAAGEVALRISACGVNFADMLMAKGKYQDTPPPPFTLGMEVCGTVIALGEGVTTPAIGTRVTVFGGRGGMAEVGVFPADLCRAVHASMPDTVAAGFQVAYGTSHLGLTRRARLQKGEMLLVLGAAGGVGLTAVEIGKVMGATVIAVARGADKLEVARAAGADHLIDSNAGDLKAQLKALCATIGGVDVVYDPVGGEAFMASLSVCNREARVVVIGFASGDIPKVPANILLVKNIDVIGFYWGGYLAFQPDALTDSLAELMQWYADGLLKPHISDVLPLDRAQDGLDLIASRKSTGKVVITP